MPVDFETPEKVIEHAKMTGFRPPKEGESEADYRESYADHHHGKDPIEAHEIRTGKGWDKWSNEDEKDALRRQGFPI